MRKAGFVLLPLAREEDESVELHSETEDGEPLEGFFEDDVDVTVHARGVGNPPEVEPVRVELRIHISAASRVQTWWN